MLDMYEIDLIAKSMVRMVKEPGAFFKEISRKQINLMIPFAFLVLVGIIMCIMKLSQIPAIQEEWKKASVDLAYNVEYRLRALKAAAFLYPIWIPVYYSLFCIAFAFLTSALGGWGEFQSFFNCVAFICYPLASLQIIKFILSLMPTLMIIYWVLLIIISIWTCYLLIQIAIGAGQLNAMHAAIAALVPAFFFMLLWLSYEPLINMIVITHRL